MESIELREAPGSGAATPSVADDPALGLDQRTKFEILGAIMLGLFLGALDQTIVGPVLPTIVTQLHGADYYTWVVTAYLLTSTVSVPIYGKLSDLYGRKQLFMGGIVLFLVGSALSGLSQEMWQLILFRGIQGLGAGSLFPISLAVIGDLFSPAERGKYQGLFGAVFGISFLVGPFTGGWLTDNLSWHWIFYVNLPIGLIALVVIARLLPSIHHAPKDARIDWLGVATLVLGLVPILIGFTQAETLAFSDINVWGWLVAGAVFLVAFVIVEGRVPQPIIPLHLFRNRTFSASMVSIFFATFGFGASIIFLPLYFQVVEGVSATASGYRLLPFLFGLILSSIVSGQIVSRTGRYKWLVVAGLTILTIGLALMTQLRYTTDDWVLSAWMFVAGLGVGPTFAVFTIIVQNSVDFHEMGTATSDLTLFRQIGTTVGITMAFTLFRDNLTWGLLHDRIVAAGAPAALVPTSPPPGFDLGALTSVGNTADPLAFLKQLPAAAQQLFLNGFHDAFTLAISNSMWLGVGAGVVAAVAAVALREIPLRKTASPGAQRMAAARADSNRVAAID
ncbi:MAG TPA: MDR family MFS transporter [Candidatus Limnocylindrales bacterium]|nr:MDR family MFS transporter [Candidatus Limnocylindrales bacterium]